MRISALSSAVCSSDLARWQPGFKELLRLHDLQIGHQSTLQLSHQVFLQRADVRQSQKGASLLRSAIDIHVDLHRRHLLLRRPVAGACVAAQTPLGIRVEPAMAYVPYRKAKPTCQQDRKSVVKGKRVSVRVDLGGRRNIKKKNNRTTYKEIGYKINNIEA